MAAYIVRRIFLSLFTIWVISMLTFFIIELPPGDQVDRFKEITESRRQIPDPEKIDLLRSYLGLDQPQYVRYAKWMWNLMQGDLGLSFQYRQEVDLPVKQLLEDRLWLTIVLTGFTVLVTWTLLSLWGYTRPSASTRWATTSSRSSASAGSPCPTSCSGWC